MIGTWCFAPGSIRKDLGTCVPCIFPPVAEKIKPPALRVVIDSKGMIK